MLIVSKPLPTRGGARSFVQEGKVETASVSETVTIFDTQVEMGGKRLRVVINRPFGELDYELKSQLVATARRLGRERHPTLRSGWSPRFVVDGTDY